MILTGSEIACMRAQKRIEIEPWDETCLGPNSYDLHIGDRLLVYSDSVLSTHKHNHTNEIPFTSEGTLLRPGKVYLAETLEYTETNGFVPMLEGRSSIGRLGLFIHATAGFGDNGFKGKWTLELVATQETFIYPGDRICQIYFHKLHGLQSFYKGRYQNAKGVEGSKVEL